MELGVYEIQGKIGKMELGVYEIQGKNRQNGTGNM